MRGQFDPAKIDGDKLELTGTIPAATSLEYPIELASKSSGKATFTTRFDSYQRCAPEEGKTTSYRGISPLDRDKWILFARGAIQ